MYLALGIFLVCCVCSCCRLYAVRHFIGNYLIFCFVNEIQFCYFWTILISIKTFEIKIQIPSVQKNDTYFRFNYDISYFINFLHDIPLIPAQPRMCNVCVSRLVYVLHVTPTYAYNPEEYKIISVTTTTARWR